MDGSGGDEGLKLTGEAAFGRAGLGVEDRVYGVEAALAKAIIVSLVPARGPGEHYEISVLAPWRALLRIVLKNEKTSMRLITTTFEPCFKHGLTKLLLLLLMHLCPYNFFGLLIPVT